MDPLHLRSPEEARRAFRVQGETVSGWAQRHGFRSHCVYGVLSGRIKGDWGEGHRVAVALGIKPQPEQSPKIGDSTSAATADAASAWHDDESDDFDVGKEGMPMR